MVRRQSIPFVVTLVAAFLCGGSASRLHLLAVLFAKPAVTLAVATLLLFVVRRSSDICHALLLGASIWTAWDFTHALLRRLRRPTDLQSDIPETACIRTLLQRPPPAFAR